jgi:hypothetical protein
VGKKQEKLAELFTIWRQNHPKCGFGCDGFLTDNEENCVLFIGSESNSGDIQYTECASSCVDCKDRKEFWLYYRSFCYCPVTKKYEGIEYTSEDIDKGREKVMQAKKSLKKYRNAIMNFMEFCGKDGCSVAYMNLNKSGGGSSTHLNDLRKKIDVDLIKSQLKIIAPSLIVIFGNNAWNACHDIELPKKIPHMNLLEGYDDKQIVYIPHLSRYNERVTASIAELAWYRQKYNRKEYKEAVPKPFP